VEFPEDKSAEFLAASSEEWQKEYRHRCRCRWRPVRKYPFVLAAT
jgi:hypothetical protein